MTVPAKMVIVKQGVVTPKMGRCAIPITYTRYTIANMTTGVIEYTNKKYDEHFRDIVIAVADRHGQRAIFM
jgi:hypothetical protein